MASMKFSGAIGFATPVESAPGVWEDKIHERPYYGDVLRASRTLVGGDKVNDDISVGNSISIVADPYASEHIFAMRYVRWSGVLWVVSTVDLQNPRLILSLGGVYHGPTPAAD